MRVYLYVLSSYLLTIQGKINNQVQLSGTGKSETGAHIAYALAMSNRNMVPRKCVLYCAPTNKAVDVVLSECCIVCMKSN